MYVGRGPLTDEEIKTIWKTKKLGKTNGAGFFGISQTTYDKEFTALVRKRLQEKIDTVS